MTRYAQPRTIHFPDAELSSTARSIANKVTVQHSIIMPLLANDSLAPTNICALLVS